jgi:flagellar motor switch/type III secretory pathway protein FliN
MAEFGPDIAASVLAAAQAGQGEIVEALRRAFDLAAEVAIGEPGTFDSTATAEELAGPGLAIVLKVGASAALLVLPEACGLLPDWYAAPDATGVSKLTTLAQELGMVLLPDEFMPEDFRASHVDSLAEAVARGGASAEAALLPLTLTSDGKTGRLLLVWPAPDADAVLTSDAEFESAPAASPRNTPAASADQPNAGRDNPHSRPGRVTYDTIDDGIRQLPGYARSILRIEVPLVVTLAATQQPVSRIIELGPGSIIQFDKSCEETLSLEVGGQEIAVGEAVKVGDKFGLRVTSMIMPEERFWTVRGSRGAEKAVGKGSGGKTR